VPPPILPRNPESLKTVTETRLGEVGTVACGKVGGRFTLFVGSPGDRWGGNGDIGKMEN